MKLSVILPVYNGEKTLEMTLNSLLDQTFKEFELVACVDGSKDSSEQILKTYQKKFNSFRILKNFKNLGLGPTLNKLVAHSRGEYVAMAEQDDYYYPYRLQMQMDFLDNNLDYGLVSGIAEFFNGEVVTRKFPGLLVKGEDYPQGVDFFLFNYIHQTKIVNSCMMFRKDVHTNYGLYFSKHFPNIPIDWCYFLRFSMVSKLYGLKEVLVRLDRRTDRSSITNKEKRHYKANRELLRMFKYEYPEIVTNKIYKTALENQLEFELRSNYGVSFVKKFFSFLVLYPRFSFHIKVFLERISKWKN